MLKMLKNLVKNDEGQGMAEYGLILAGIAIVVIVAIGLLGTQLDTLFDAVTAEL